MLENYLLNTFELAGQWWLPDRKEYPVSGQLTFSPDTGILLVLMNSLFPEGTPQVRHQREVILGLTPNGTKCTLINNKTVGSTAFWSGNTTERWSGRFLFLGSHFPMFPAARFNSWMVHFANMEEWKSSSPFKWNSDLQTDLYTFPESIDISIPSQKYQLSVLPQVNHRSSIYRIEMEHTENCVIEPEECQDFYWYWKRMRQIRNFLTLLMAAPTHLTEIVCTIKDEETDKISEYCRLYFSQPSRRNEAIFQEFMLLTYPTIEHKFAGMLEKWLSNFERFEPLQDLFFGYVEKPDMYSYQSFLSLMQGLESYHRTTENGAYVSKEEYEDIATRLLNALPKGMNQDLRASLKSRIKYGNEYSLRRRLNLLLQSIDPRLRDIVDGHHKQFVSKIVDDRNYLTHRDQETRPTEFSEQRLYYFTEKLKTLVIILLLQELGLETELIHQAIIHNPVLWPWRG